jgi:hypothetical protein
MFLKKGQGQHLNVTVKVVTESLDNTTPHIVHPIGLTKVRTPSEDIEYHDGKREQLQHSLVSVNEDFVQNGLYEIGGGSSKGCHQYHAEHGQDEAKPF